jgi:hypothetical protein
MYVNKKIWRERPHVRLEIAVPVMHEETDIYTVPVKIVTDVALLLLLSHRAYEALAFPLQMKCTFFSSYLLSGIIKTTIEKQVLSMWAGLIRLKIGTNDGLSQDNDLNLKFVLIKLRYLSPDLSICHLLKWYELLINWLRLFMHKYVYDYKIYFTLNLYKLLNLSIVCH